MSCGARPPSTFTPLMKKVGVTRTPSSLPRPTSVFTDSMARWYAASKSVTPPIVLAHTHARYGG